MPDTGDSPDIYEECPFCDAEKLPSRIGFHLYEEHWDEIVPLAQNPGARDS